MDIIINFLFKDLIFIACRFFSRKAKSPDAKAKTPEPQVRSDVSDKSTKTIGSKSAKAPQIRVSTVSIYSIIANRIKAKIFPNVDEFIHINIYQF